MREVVERESRMKIGAGLLMGTSAAQHDPNPSWG